MNTLKIRPLVLNGFSLTALLTAMLLSQAQAHDVWIEDTPAHQLVIHFGEFGDELETSPGYLDSLSPPKAWTVNMGHNPIPFEIQKQTNSFRLTGASITNLAAAETDYEVLSATNKPSRKPYFYARWQPAHAGAGTPTLTLDLVPESVPGEIRLYFRGQPVDGETITAHGPADYETNQVTDATGRVHFHLKEPGLYLFTCNHHRETLAGFSAGRHYDLASHNASLTLRLPEATTP